MTVLQRMLVRASRILRPEPEMQQRIAEEFDRARALEQPEFPACLQLPPLYAKGLPERAVELLIAWHSYRPGLRVLDVGHAYAMLCHLHMIRALPQPRRLTGVDIANPQYDSRPYYQASLIGDITRSTIPGESFDLIWCISALEHFGMDNSLYTSQFDQTSGQDARALGEMVRILAPGGTLVVTVPYGRYEDHRTMKNYDAQRWQALLETVRSKARVREMYFRHTFGAGWAQAESPELRYVGYYDQANAGAGAIAIAYITKPHNAGAGRTV
jgi:SAM-dependent methyltransferase